MTVEEILKYCYDNFEGTILKCGKDEKGVFYNPDNHFIAGVPVLTVDEHDSDKDKESKLERENIYRINMEIGKNTFKRLFHVTPRRIKKSGIDSMNYDFTMLDRLMPHPAAAWLSRVCILNPSKQTFEELKPLINEAYKYAKKMYEQNVRFEKAIYNTITI